MPTSSSHSPSCLATRPSRLERALPGMSALAGQGITSATNFLTGVFVGQTCSKDEFGLYMLGLTIILLASNIQMALISTPFMVSSPRLKGKRLARYTGSTLLHQAALGVLGAGLLAMGAGLSLLGIGPEGLGRVLSALVLSLSFILLREYLRRLLFATLRMHIALILDVGVALLQLGGLALLSIWGLISADRAMLVNGLACALISLVCLAYRRVDFSPKPRIAWLDLRRNWTFGKWIFVSSLIWSISMMLYPWILTHFHGTAAAGVWGACFGIVSLANPLLIGLSNYLGPKIVHTHAREGRGGLRHIVYKSSLLLFALMGLCCLGFCLFGDWLVVTCFGAPYSGNAALVALLALRLPVAAVAFIFSRALFTVKRADLDCALSSLSLAVLLTAGIALSRTHGPIGAAIGLLAANTMAALAKGLTLHLLVRDRAEQPARLQAGEIAA
jgi:O-antigen/teichoic acid export membrane protein